MIELSTVSQAISSRSLDVRQDAAEAIREAVLSLRETLCDRLLTERNELALVSVLQTIQMLDVDAETLAVVSDLAEKDRRPLVRASAVYALGGRLRDGFLESRLLSEKSSRVRVEILLALYEAGKRRVIGDLLRLMRANDYHTQCAAINGLADIVRPADRALVVDEIQALLNEPIPAAVVSTAERALEDLGG